MILAVISDTVWNSLITGAVAVAMAWIGYKLKVIEKTGEKTLHIVNSGVGSLLERHKDATRRLADLPGAPESDKTAANIAEQASDEHQKVQAIVDSKETKS